MQLVLTVYPLVENWCVCDGSDFRTIRRFHTKREAIMFARSFTYDQDTEIIIHDDKWNVDCIESYARNPIEQQVAEHPESSDQYGECGSVPA